MSETDVEILRSAFNAFNRGDVDAVLEHLAPDVELDWSRAVGPQRGVYRLDQIRPFLEDFLVWTIREGAIIRCCLYQDKQEALEAAGLRE